MKLFGLTAVLDAGLPAECVEELAEAIEQIDKNSIEKRMLLLDLGRPQTIRKSEDPSQRRSSLRCSKVPTTTSPYSAAPHYPDPLITQ